jgi:hypothetical protein
MKKILILFLLLGCQEPDYKKCNMALVISDASEIQFTPTGQSSFNLEQMGFTDDYCFHQKFLCSGTRRFQGYETLETPVEYYLIGFDEAGVEIFNEMYTRVSELISAYIDALADGSNYGSGDETWTISSNPTVTGLTTGEITKLYRVPIINGMMGQSIDITIDLDFNNLGGSGGTLNCTPVFYLYNSDMSMSVSYTEGDPGFPVYISAGNKVHTINLEATGFVPAYFAYSLEYTGSGGFTLGVDINSITITSDIEYLSKYSLSLVPSDESMCDKYVTFKIFDGPDPETDTEIYYTDSVEFVTTWSNSNSEGRVDIQYRSIQNFAGLLYDESSPYFLIQLTGRFRKERKITAQKSLELTEMVLNTAASVKKQRKLTLDDLPDYMHTKVNLILAHAASGSVLVDGMEITLEEGYEEGDRPETYPLTPAEVQLTIKDYYKHNVI